MANYTSREDEEFFGAIGRLTISWAHLELGLDCVIELLHHGLGGKEVEPEVPIALKRKIRYLRAYLKRYPLPEDTAKGFASLFEQILAASETRHDIIHGAVTEHIERSGKARFIRLIRSGGQTMTKEFHATTTSILEAAKEVNQLGDKTLRWATELQKFLRELPPQPDAQTRS